MADRLAKRGLPHHPACPICDQAEETIQHILISCVFTQQVWTLVFQKLSMATLAPPADATHFFRWWENTIRNSPRRCARGLIPLLFWWPGKYENLGMLVCLRELPLIFRVFCTRSLMNVALGAFSGWQYDPIGCVL